MIGRLFDSRYDVVSKLGSGRVADVYLADDRVLGGQVALKVLAPRFAADEQFLERFRREVSRAAALIHPNIVQISHRGQAEDTYYVAMEYLAGRSLQTIILELAPLSADLLTSIALQILEALRFAHRQNVIHGDIRPGNIMIDSEGGVKVTDFGIARAAQERPADAASDLHSVGVVMYQMATGRLPSEGGNVGSIPGKLGAIIMRALGVDSTGMGPADRYLNAQAMLDDLLGMQNDDAEVTPRGFAEEAARVLGATAMTGVAATDGAPARGDRPLEQPAPLPDEETPVFEPDEQPGRPRRTWPWVLVTILILALTASAYLIVSNLRATDGPEFGTVPKVVGLTEARAIDKIQAAGFGHRVQGRQPSWEVQEGDVVRQETAAGTKLEKGRTIGIWISSGTGQIAVPDVFGLTQAEATKRLRDTGLEVVAKPEVGVDVKVGTVLRQNPEAGRKVNPGVSVTITVAAVTNTVRVPILKGMSQDSAVALLKGMDLAADLQETDSTLPRGTVDHQDPAGASEVQPGTTVKLFVSNAPEAKTVIVPAVGALGLTEAEAKAILAKFRLKAEVIDLETPDSKPGLCIYQDPALGAEVKIGSVVKITIAREPTTTTAPPPAAGAIRYDHTDTRIVRTGIWVDYRATAAYLGSYGRSSAVGTSATIYFTGTRLDWIAMKGTTTGVVDVYLDGAKKATINLAAPTATYMVNVWSTGSLARGSHRVRIVLSSSSPAGKYLTLDAVDIWGTIASR